MFTRRLFICYPSVVPLKRAPICPLPLCWICQWLLTANINSHKISTPQWHTQPGGPRSIPAADQWVDNAAEMKTPASHQETRGWRLWGQPVGGVLNWNTQHKFRPNHLIVSVLLERISSHAKLLRVPALSCSLPSCFVCVVVCVCWAEPMFSLALFFFLILFTFSILVLVNHCFSFLLSLRCCYNSDKGTEADREPVSC